MLTSTLTIMKLQKYPRIIRGKKYYQYLLTVKPNLVKLCDLENKELEWKHHRNGLLLVVK